jgi:hypothetical protein
LRENSSGISTSTLKNHATAVPTLKHHFDKRVAFILERVIELIHRALRCCFGKAKQMLCDALEVQNFLHVEVINHS